MVRGLSCLLCLAVYTSLGSGTSVPTSCFNVFCPEGQTCIASTGSCSRISTKDGVCQTTQRPDAEFEACLTGGVSLCSTDNDCEGQRKCCFGCCQMPELATALRLQGKPGTCPVDNLSREFREFLDRMYCPQAEPLRTCNQDSDCPWVYKCCQSLCDYQQCRFPDRNSVGNPVNTETTTEEPGTTPTPTEGPTSFRPDRPAIEPVRRGGTATKTRRLASAKQ